MNMRDYSRVHLEIYYNKGTAQPAHVESKGMDVETAFSKTGCGGRETWGAIKYYTKTHIKVKENIVVRKHTDLNEHERLSNITLRYKL